ncbi:AraC family transcriptional regulator [Sphingomonas sp.]|jgi:AraC family transcriptional activator of pyochelin receptor|uniref:helix-turn-helix domain-containing protein n=1 Tax=Sphingomonas sp. TaxID=28214 RepID=UPI002DE203B6|nr:AraC family transcriptional regulator [Sphingomonas sp.]
MLSFVGTGALVDLQGPEEPVGIGFRLDEGVISFHPRPLDSVELEDAQIALVVAQAACRRIFNAVPDRPMQWHMPEPVRLIAFALLESNMAEPARTTLRLGKSIELLCAFFVALFDGALIETGGAASLSELDARRIVAARRMIEEQSESKLTLDSIARACGLNRAKLTRGFRAMFGCSVAEAIADRRLTAAHQMLLASELPVGTIGYRCGYSNNASFTRAFARRYGAPPSQMRNQRAVA